MRIQQLQPNLNFEARKKRYIDIESQEQLTQILRKMDKETVYQSNGATFESTRITRLELFNHGKNKKIAELVDTRRNLNKIPEGYDMVKETLLTIGKTELVIDNKSGEIIDWNKPFFSSWKGIMKRISDTLITINATYHHPEHVKKHYFAVQGFTQKGYNKLQSLLKGK